MSKYLLPCECGQSTPVDASQAGSTVTCQCGKAIEVPTLRGIRELTPYQDPDAKVSNSAEWSPAKGAVFAVSLILLICGVPVLTYGYRNLRAVPPAPLEQEMELYATALEQTEPAELFEAWTQIREEGLGDRGHNAFVHARRFRARMKAVTTTGVTLIVAGLAGMFVAVVMPRKPI